MAFKTVDVNTKYYKYNECKHGDVLVNSGVYKGQSEGKFGTQAHFIQDDGQAVTLNKAQQLLWVLDNKCKVGQKMNVIFDKTIILEKGLYKGKQCHNFIIQVDDSTFSESAPAQATGAAYDAGPDISL